MNPAALPSWAIGALVFILFGVLPAVANVLDLPDETDALAITAQVAEDLEREGPAFALGGPLR
ncbi:hypothetical protein [Pseudacidovorax sp. RU35E]|uniref:hypothetical protein n=1 Tax=Pseudacidovorax sp. RU35E TaxID=1907403 RepID=UPI0009546493|nr:hypothetical protein [Pseudacidovorax sp. RU35E]SIR00622.1 hypothetical protein SAMN05880557_107101 [Pseudacidovorax sp. RU35E]